MDTLPRLFPVVRILLLCFAALLVSGVADAQQQPISVSPTSVSVQATVGTNAPSQTVQVKKRGKPTAQVSWTVLQPSGGWPSWVSASTTGGVNDGTFMLIFNTSTLAVNTYQTSFGVQAAGSSPITVNVQATIVGSAPPPPPALVANCPANITASSPNGQPVSVSYTIPSPSGGTPPYTSITGSPASGSNFPVGTTTVTVTVQDSSQPQQTDDCTFTVTVTDDSSPPPPPSSGVGPQSTITCPATRVDITTGHTVAQIQSLINANPGATTFCFLAGTHFMNGSITPKPDNIFIGQYGAILDGTGWTTTDDSQAAFRVYDDPNDPNDPTTDVGNVTIKNLVIRNMPQYGIHGSYTRRANGWTVQYNEIAANKFGVMFTRDAVIQNNYIHHNVGNPTASNPGDRGGGYVGQFAVNAVIDNNEIAYNGPEQKVHSATNVMVRNNFVHHNVRDGIWFDFNNNPQTATLAATIQGNRFEDNRGNGVTIEISIGVDISNNTFLRNGEDAVLITVSQNADIHHNVLNGNQGGIEFFLNCGAFAEGFDLKNNAAHDNTITVTQAVSDNFGYANGFSHLSQCTSTQLAPYVNNQKGLTFNRNTYHVPSLGYTRYFLWDGWKDWTAWTTTLGPNHDQDGSIVAP